MSYIRTPVGQFDPSMVQWGPGTPHDILAQRSFDLPKDIPCEQAYQQADLDRRVAVQERPDGRCDLWLPGVSTRPAEGQTPLTLLYPSSMQQQPGVPVLAPWFSPGAELIGLGAAEEPAAGPSWLWRMLSAVGAGLGAYHGYKRNNSVGWGVVWGLAGAVAPVATVPIALAQGFGKPRGTR